MRASVHRIVRGQRGRTVFEALIAVILFLALIFFAVERYYAAIKPVRETALTMELSNLRRAVYYYTVINKRLPGSLKELVEGKAVVTKNDIDIDDMGNRIIFMGKYIETMDTDAEDYPTDPFGNRFDYDPASGKVSSSTKGYETW